MDSVDLYRKLIRARDRADAIRKAYDDATAPARHTRLQARLHSQLRQARQAEVRIWVRYRRACGDQLGAIAAALPWEHPHVDAVVSAQMLTEVCGPADLDTKGTGDE